MSATLAQFTQAHPLLTILGGGALLFVIFATGLVVPWMGKPVSRKTYLAICEAFTAIWGLVAAFFAFPR